MGETIESPLEILWTITASIVLRGLREGPSIIQHYRGEGFEGGALHYTALSW